MGKHVTEGYFSGNPYIDASYFNGEEGWWGAGVYEAGGKVALGYPRLGGALNTPSRELYGHLHITFRARVVDETRASATTASPQHGLPALKTTPISSR